MKTEISHSINNGGLIMFQLSDYKWLNLTSYEHSLFCFPFFSFYLTFLAPSWYTTEKKYMGHMNSSWAFINIFVIYMETLSRNTKQNVNVDVLNWLVIWIYRIIF